MAYPQNAYKTSDILLNETLLGYADSCEFLQHGVNHDYEEKIAEVDGMPTGGTIKVRRQGFRKPQKGLEMDVSAVAQEYETITADPANITGDAVSLTSADYLLDRTPVTDTTHYQIAKSIGIDVNLDCYRDLKSSVNMFVGSDTASAFDFDTLVDLQIKCTEMNIPQDGAIYTNVQDYGSIAKSINTGGIFDEKLNESANRFLVGNYGGYDIIKSQQLLTIRHTAGSASADTGIQFAGLVSTDAFRSAVINLQGASAGATLLAGDRIEFADTKTLSPTSRLSTTQPLQLVVQPQDDGTNEYTADGSGNFANVNVKCGILPMTGTGSTASSADFANVSVVPSTGEAVNVLGDHKLNFYTTSQGFTFASLLMPDLSTLQIPGLGKDSKKSFQTRTQRDKNNTLMNLNEPLNIRTSYDADTLKSRMFMRVDTFPVYKAFYGLNVAIVTKL